MPRRRLAWIGAGAVVAAAIVAALLWRDAAPGAPRGPPSTHSGGATGGTGSDAAAPARAGSAGDAAALVASARAEVAAGRLVPARALLTRAYALDPTPATLLELAGVEFQTGHCREARRATQRVVNEASGELADRARRLLDQIGRCD
jgi:hypothetical protein